MSTNEIHLLHHHRIRASRHRTRAGRTAAPSEYPAAGVLLRALRLVRARRKIHRTVHLLYGKENAQPHPSATRQAVQLPEPAGGKSRPRRVRRPFRRPRRGGIRLRHSRRRLPPVRLADGSSPAPAAGTLCRHTGHRRRQTAGRAEKGCLLRLPQERPASGGKHGRTDRQPVVLYRSRRIPDARMQPRLPVAQPQEPEAHAGDGIVSNPEITTIN